MTSKLEVEKKILSPVKIQKKRKILDESESKQEVDLNQVRETMKIMHNLSMNS